MIRVDINLELLRWARERANISEEQLIKQFPKYSKWETGEVQPTLKQIQKLSKYVHTPFGYFFLSKPPEEHLPIPDFRTIENSRLGRPSVDLLQTIYLCQRRQHWYQEFAREDYWESLEFIGSENLTSDTRTVAANIRTTLNLDIEQRRKLTSWNKALQHFIQMSDKAGILVMTSGVVENNTKRKLNPSEFRGFALVDELAPLIFINGADTKAAQMFTLAHELAHLWLGQSALSDTGPDTLHASIPENQHSLKIETWCNRVAAELLVPLAILREEYRNTENIDVELNRLARIFKVSTLVILRRVFDLGKIERKQFQSAYKTELNRLLKFSQQSDGGNFYHTLNARVGRRFSLALVTRTLEGNNSYTETFQLLGISKDATFRKFAENLGVVQ